MEIVLLWLLFGVFSAMIASGKNRSTAGWFFVGILFGPFGLLVAAMPKLDDSAKESKPSHRDSDDTVKFSKISATDFEIAKQQIFEQYKPIGFNTVALNKPGIYMLKNKSGAYVNLKGNGDSISIQTYNAPKPTIRLLESRQIEAHHEKDVGPKDIQITSVADELKKLNALKEEGILTDDEFSSQKAKLLNS